MNTASHLTQFERKMIEKYLNEGRTFQFIAQALHRHNSTISREITKHFEFKKIGCHGNAFNDCRNRHDCTNRNLCAHNNCMNKLCKRCTDCYHHCPDYAQETCELLKKPPYVCNGCPTRSKCTLEKRFYFASHAQKEYKHILSESRSGIRISKERLSELDSFLSPLLQNGQSIDHILAHNPEKIPCSRRTLYNYIDAGILTARNIDLPKKVRFRSRTSLKSSTHVSRSCRLGRSYKDFMAFKKKHPQCPVVELDSVEGIKGGKVLLTVHFVQCEFMLAFLRKKNTAKSVAEIFDSLYHLLGPITFRQLFPLLLVDNGSEFSDPDSLEKDSLNNFRTRVFYCNPLAPYQKGAAENNHTFIRRIVPKGTSFNTFTQQDITLMMNHINSYSRSTLNNRSPYDVFLQTYGKEILDIFHASPIPPNKIILHPKLLSLSNTSCPEKQNHTSVSAPPEFPAQ